MVHPDQRAGVVMSSKRKATAVLNHPVLDNVTTASAVGAITSSYWIPKLAEVSDICGHLAPILGVIWLLMQIYYKVTRT